MKIFAIDPGSELSGFCILNENCTPLKSQKIKNSELLELLKNISPYRYVVEEIRAIGMATPQDVIDTARFTGRIEEITGAAFIPRREVKMHLCGSVSANDSNVICALVDRFGNRTEHGRLAKGTKKNPGFFYGFKKDMWQAFALGVYYADALKKEASFA